VKYLAILRDSFREALDSKILFVTFALSGLMILFIASVSIRPITMEEELQKRAGYVQFVLGTRLAGLECKVVEFKQTNAATEPWKGDYEFTFVLTVPMSPGEAKVASGVRSVIPSSVGDQLAAFIRLFFLHLNIVDMKQQPGPGNEFRLKVITQGTHVTRVEDWNHEPVLFFGALPAPWLLSSPASMVLFIENNLVNAIAGWIIVLFGIIATASFVPNLLRKGSADLVLAKPIGRAQLLLFKYLGGLTFLFLNASFIIVAVWLCVGLRSGIWSWAFLLTIPLLTFFFAILYGISTLLAVLTRSTVVCILVTCMAWFLLWLVGLLYGLVHPDPILPDSVQAKAKEVQGQASDDSGLQLPRWASGTINTLHRSLPRTRDLGRLTKQFLSRDLMPAEQRREQGLEVPGAPGWGESLGASAAWIAGLLGLACWRFSRRDY
jgi:ABC-type transport system involved in multi-copper enzyme maturation permease subunit